VVELVRAALGPCHAPEIVEGDRVDTRGRETLGKVFIEGVEATDVRRDDNPSIAA